MNCTDCHRPFSAANPPVSVSGMISDGVTSPTPGQVPVHSRGCDRPCPLCNRTIPAGTGVEREVGITDYSDGFARDVREVRLVHATCPAAAAR